MSAADAYFIGRIQGCSGFSAGSFCRWWLCAGNDWKIVSGVDRGRSQTDTSTDLTEAAVWSHPVDVYYEFRSIQGWPKISFEVWEYDSLERCYLGGYGFAPLPMSPGNHDIDVHLWRPVGTFAEDLTVQLLGGSPHLQDTSITFKPVDRFRISSESTGIVHINISLILGRISSFPIAF